MTKKSCTLRAAAIIGAGFLVALTTGASRAAENDFSSVPIKSFEQLTDHQKFARKQLIATIKLYDDHLRVASTGQYLDKVDTEKLEQTSKVSSIASTGVGLISLAIGDQLGVIDDAAEKARITLTSLLNEDPNAAFYTPRSKSGWYKHFIDVNTGEGLRGSKHVFSTIDTAILGVGANMVARYFATLDDPVAQDVAGLAKKLVEGVNWGQAVRFDRRPGVHQIFRGPEEEIENRFWSVLFDEYVIIPCLGRSVEASMGRHGPATTFWNSYVGDASNLPQADLDGLSVLAVNGKRVPSHFTHQFAFYFCGDLAADPAYRAELNELRLADQKWFKEASNEAYPDRWWGLGAGSEIKFDKETGEIKYSGYGVARIGKNPNHTFSPAIMAGFLPVENAQSPTRKTLATFSPNLRDFTQPVPNGHSDIIADLIALHERNECRYDYAGLDFLWRCSARDTSLRVRHIEGVDLSTYLLGLAWFDPAIGQSFFESNAVKARTSFPEARELKASLSSELVSGYEK